jgi:hypothetical protein
MEQDLEIEPSEGRLQNNAAYIQSWKEEIRENPNALFTAITDADKIAKYVSERTQEYRHTKDVQYYAIIEETNAYSEQVYPLMWNICSSNTARTCGGYCLRALAFGVS